MAGVHVVQKYSTCCNKHSVESYIDYNGGSLVLMHRLAHICCRYSINTFAASAIFCGNVP